MRVSLFRLDFPNGFLLAPAEHNLALNESLLHVPADTLFSALVTAWSRRGNDPACWLAPFLEGKPPFLLTSAFPWARGEPWFPKPLGYQPSPEWKRASFLPEVDFFRAAKGRDPEAPRAVDVAEVEQLPRVTLDRTTNQSNLFHVARVRFLRDCGLWFGVGWRDPGSPCGAVSFRTAFEQALQELAQAGLGGDRGMGCGRFTAEHVDDVDWPDPLPEGWGVLLSRLWPKEAELSALRQSRAWRFVEVGGYAETAGGHVLRRRVRLVAEGSVVPSALCGALAPLAPSWFTAHPIWRYGLAFLYPWEVSRGPQN